MPDKGIKSSLYGCDQRWWAHHVADISRDFDGRCYTQDVQWEQHDPEAWGITKLTSIDQPGLSQKQGVIHRGQNSGYQAVNLAYLLGGSNIRIVLLGFDMQKEGGKRHWFGAHPGTMEVDSNYQMFIKRFESINPADYGIEIVNATRRTALNHFPQMSLEDALCTD